MLHNYVTNEFKNSAVAKDQTDVRTTWSESKVMVITSSIMLVALFVTFAKQFG